MQIQQTEQQNLQMLQTKPQTLVLNKLTIEERQLVVIEFDKDRIGQFDNERKKELAKKLVQLSFFVGIKEPLTIDELKMSVGFLCQQFPNITMKKIEDAFMKVSAGELGFIEHFQQFSPTYVAKVIRAYETQSKAALSKYMKHLEKHEAEEESKKKAQSYDPVQAIISALKLELKKHHDKSLDDFNAFDDFQSKVTIELGQKIDLFMKFDAKEITEKRYLRNFFKWLLQNELDSDKAIEKYVMNNSRKQKE
jgi:hypothetical protein